MPGKLVRDPIHEYISFSEEERRLIDSPWFQRLRHCLQNGPTRLVYPSIVGTRFEHSLGVMDLASRILDSVLDEQKYAKGSKFISEFLSVCRRDLRLFLGRRKRNDDEVITDLRRLLRASALCHDLGHFPLSHTLERAFRQEYWTQAIPAYYPVRQCHELISAELIRYILEISDPAIEDWLGRGIILTLLAPSALTVRYRRSKLPFNETMFYTLNGILVGDYDADRLDYLQRDGYLSGSGFGRFDVQRFIDAMRLTKKDKTHEVLPSSYALSTVEAALIERYKLYKWVYFHHKTLFFDEVCCEAARKILKSPKTAKEILEKYEKDVGNPQEYLKAVLKSLSSPTENLRPLILFRGESLGLTHEYYRLNPDFFINNKDSHFFDDVWFCLKCRDRQQLGSTGTFYLETLVDRKACGMTLWKDWSQFTKFFDKCLVEARKSTRLATKVEGDSVQVYGPKFLDILWQLMREGKFPEAVCHKMIGRAKLELKKVNNGSLRALVRVANWRLFGNLRDKQIIGKTGRRDFLVNHSSLLRGLSELRGEIPFYAFVVGEAADLTKVKKNKKIMDRILTIIAKTFIIAIVDCFEEVEIFGAWNEAKKQGS